MLERDGLVKQSGKRGVVVADITPEEADELYLVHGHLIGLATRLACRRMKGEALEQHGQIGRQTSSMCGAKRPSRLSRDARRTGTSLICERSFSPRLAHLFEVMAYPSARYRVFHVSVPGYMEEVARCYEGVCDAFSKGDALAAERCRLEVMDIGRNLLRQYFIEPQSGYKQQEQTSDQP